MNTTEVPSTTTDARTRWSVLRDELRARRASHRARKQLERELATYTTAADVDDLLAVLEHDEGADAAVVRDILVRTHLRRAA